MMPPGRFRCSLVTESSGRCAYRETRAREQRNVRASRRLARYEVAIQEMMGGKFQATVTNERLQQISPKKAGDLRAVTEFAYEQVARIEKRVKEQEEMERQCDASKRTLLAEVKLMAAEIESS